jgi:DNA-binding NarL/FixJ family response regulator
MREKELGAANKRTNMSATHSEGCDNRRAIFVVSSHPIHRQGFVHVISASSRFMLLGQAAKLQAAIPRSTSGAAHALLVDVSPPTDITASSIQSFIGAVPLVPVLVVSTQDERIFAEQMMRAGAHGYVMEQAGGPTLLQALWRVSTGHFFVGKWAVEAWAKSFALSGTRKANSSLSGLSSREIEVLQLLGQGKSTHSIATLLHISPRTVDVHRTNIRQKLQLASMTDLLCFAIRWSESQNDARNSARD